MKSASSIKPIFTVANDLSLNPIVNHQKFQVGDSVWTRYLTNGMSPFVVLSVDKISEENIGQFRSSYPNVCLDDIILRLGESQNDTQPRFSVAPRWQQVINVSEQARSSFLMGLTLA